ncbi:NADP-dependent oxidoreductase [Phanerochaete sordida]|uniref:NADP-dependent oxidoreductase n=1 Tax=Phanerochaete sordida TaxID=48140 RepID=A0A9P3LG85_9APHY|nr:NADP-dependent oxidoreductase [Phanerochaete sordida]
MVKNGVLLYAAHPTGAIDADTYFAYAERDLDLARAPLSGGVLLRTLFLSSDPYLRVRMCAPEARSFVPPFRLGEPVDNFGVAQVLRSEDPHLAPGDYVVGYLDFAEYSVYPGKDPHEFKIPLTKVQVLPGIPLSVYLGTLGMPGTTAFQGLTYFCADKLKTAEVMFVSGGAGPVGTFVIEYAKLLAPHVKIVASAGTSEKLRIMQSVGADVVFNYKEQDAVKVLQEQRPLDIFWDNTGGPQLDAALQNFRDEGLIISCGAISQNNLDEKTAVKHIGEFSRRSLTMRGILVYKGESAAVAPRFYDEVVPLVLQGKITSREHRYQGLQQAGKALADVHRGANTGKAVIVVAEE